MPWDCIHWRGIQLHGLTEGSFDKRMGRRTVRQEVFAQ
jgi:hypothetical protein